MIKSLNIYICYNVICCFKEKKDSKKGVFVIVVVEYNYTSSLVCRCLYSVGVHP